MSRPVPTIPELRPLRYVDEAIAALALVPVEECVLEVEDAAEAAAWRRAEREERAARPYRPPFRCTSCHRYVSPSVPCKACGSRGQTNTEGSVTSYVRAHARRQARKQQQRRAA
jgi:hypothetical protein